MISSILFLSGWKPENLKNCAEETRSWRNITGLWTTGSGRRKFPKEKKNCWSKSSVRLVFRLWTLQTAGVFTSIMILPVCGGIFKQPWKRTCCCGIPRSNRYPPGNFINIWPGRIGSMNCLQHLSITITERFTRRYLAGRTDTSNQKLRWWRKLKLLFGK